MKAEERKISNVLTEQLCYEIPSYQRPYSWRQENVQQLLEDLWESYDANDREYFIGSLITIERERDRLYDVVDGQQRLTTLNLIIARLRDHIAEEAAKAELGKRILPRNVLTGEAETPRLVLRRSDRSFFRNHVLEAVPVSKESRGELEAPQQRIAENLDAIDSFFVEKSDQVLKLFANFILTSVYVVFVTTDSWLSAYRLFNVLNARGMPLSNADLIKNALFGQLGQHTNRSDELEERWLELEQELGIDRLDAFFGHHRTSVLAAKARGSLHEEMEPIIRATTGGPFAFLDEIIRSAKNYMRILEGDFVDASALRAVRALLRVAYDEWIPPLLAFLNQPVSGISEAEYLILLEKITMQNWVRRLGRTARLTVYFQLITAIRQARGRDEIRQIFQKNAHNTEFLELLGGEVYGRPFDSVVLLRLEEAAQDVSVTKSYSGQLTIEHVLPQALKDEYWKQRFSEEEHKLWLNRLGNLALLEGRKNYKAQYYDFDRKKRIYAERSARVSFDLTKEICDCLEWTTAQVKARQEQLLELATRTWSI